MPTLRRCLGVLGCLSLGLVPNAAFAQAGPPDLGALRTPPSPAFTLLDIEPSAVERPATPSDAALTIINTLRDGGVPRNFAFEASPYWLAGRPRLTWRDDARRSVGSSLARTASVSVATSEAGSDAAGVTSVAVGVRALLASGRLADSSARELERLEAILGEESAFFLRLMNENGLGDLDAALKACVAANAANPGVCTADYEARKSTLTDVVLASDAYKQSSPMRRARDVVARREGFFLEVAAGFVWDFANGNWDSQQFRKRAVWITPSYDVGRWALVGVLRYVDDSLASDEDAVDWGGRAVYSTSQYAVSLEYLERSLTEPSESPRRRHRLVGVAEYRITEGTWLVASFGKDRARTPPAETLVAQLGVSFNFSRERYRF